MNLKRNLRFSIIKWMRFWNRPWEPRLRRICEDLKFILEPIKKFPKSIDKQNRTENGYKQTEQRKNIEPKYDPSKDKNKSTYQKWKNPKETIKLFMEGFALMLAIIAGCIYFWQAQEAKRQAMAAEGQLAEMQAQMRLDQRAWVLPFEVDGEPADIQTNAMFFVVNFKNTGKTPAINVCAVMKFTDSLDLIPQRDPTNAILTVSSILAPDGVANINKSSHPVPRKILTEDIGTGRVKLYFYGTIWYDDIFGSNHWVQYCYWVNPNFKEFDPAGPHNRCDGANGN